MNVTVITMCYNNKNIHSSIKAIICYSGNVIGSIMDTPLVRLFSCTFLIWPKGTKDLLYVGTQWPHAVVGDEPYRNDSFDLLQLLLMLLPNLIHQCPCSRDAVAKTKLTQ